MLAQRGRHVIGAFGDQRQDCLFHRQATPGRDAKLGRRAGSSILAHHHAATQLRPAVAQRLKHHIKRHHFGEGCRVARFICAGVNQDRAGAGFHDNGGIARTADLRFGGAPRQGGKRQPEHRPDESTGKAPQALATNPHSKIPQWTKAATPWPRIPLPLYIRSNPARPAKKDKFSFSSEG